MPSRSSTSRRGGPGSRRKQPGGCRGRWAALARSCVSAPATAAPSWPRRSPRHERGPDRRSPIGTLAVFGAERGERIENGRQEPALIPPARIVGVSGERMVLLRRPEVSFAEADGNDVWLVTEEGRLQAAVHGIDRLEEELAGGEFMRVHRRFIVNLSCVRAVYRGPRGELSLIMDRAAREAVPVSRRHAPVVRRALGL